MDRRSFIKGAACAAALPVVPFALGKEPAKHLPVRLPAHLVDRDILLFGQSFIKKHKDGTVERIDPRYVRIDPSKMRKNGKTGMVYQVIEHTVQQGTYPYVKRYGLV